MRRFSLIALLIFLASQVFASQLLVGTYNIRLKVASDSVKGEVWNKRCQVMCDQVNFMAPAIFGAQEVLHEQLIDMLDALDGYDYIGVGRDDGVTGGEYSAIFYKTSELRLLDYGNFWLNETPDRPGLGWDAACVRICTWGRFARQTASNDESFYYFNLHMDHVGVVARREAAKLIVSRIREIAQGAPVIVTGDFNVDQKDEIYAIFTGSGLLKDTYEAARLRYAENGTFNSFDINLYSDSRIDHVMVSPAIEVESYGILTNSYWVANGNSDATVKGHDAPQQIDFSHYTRRQPSDHYPVFVRLKL